MALAFGNSLPPKESHLKACRRALSSGEMLSQSELVKSSRLTKTQALCALDELIRTGEAKRDDVSGKYFLSESSK